MAVLGCVGATMLGGCVATASPRLSVADVRVTEVSGGGSSMVVVVRAENPNDQPLPLRDVEYRVSLDGSQVFSATRAAEAVLPRYGAVDLELPVAVPAGLRPAGESEFRLSMVLHYLAPGKVAETLYDSGLRRPTVSGGGEGRVDLGG